MSYLNELNEQQLAAVTADPDDAIMVVSSPGSGKTRVLTSRVAYLVDHCSVDASKIVVTTYTRRAAEEMRERLRPLIGDRTSALRIGTIHSVCLRILGEEGLKKDVLQEWEQRKIIWAAIGYKKLNWDVGWRYPLGWIMKAKARMVEPKGSESAFLRWLSPISGNDFQAKDLAQKLSICYNDYELAKGQMRKMDFSDMLLWVQKRLHGDDDFRERWQRRMQYVLIDEAQDSNNQAYEILRTLAAPENRFFAVADPDQELFRWAGADPDHNVFGFQGFYPDSQVLRLETNYRSTKAIIDVSNRAISGNYDDDDERGAYKKNIQPRPDAPEGKDVHLEVCANPSDEAQFVVSEVQHMLETEDRAPGDIFVIYRVNSQSRALEDAFLRAKVPFIVQGSLGFYDRKVIKDMLAYLAIIEDENDDEAFDRICNIASEQFFRGTRGFGMVWKAECSALAEGHGESMWQAMLRMLPRASRFQKGGIDDFVHLVQNIRAVAGKDPVAAVKALRESCYDAYLLRSEGIDETEAMEKGLFDNLDELVSAASSFGTIARFLEHVQMMRELQEQQQNQEIDAVVLTTIHRVKGLERPVVFGVGLAENILPHRYAILGMNLDAQDKLPFESLSGVEDERCAMFVMVSRAKEELFLSYPTFYRHMPMEPSRFLFEIGLIEEEEKEPELAPAVVAEF